MIIATRLNGFLDFIRAYMMNRDYKEVAAKGPNYKYQAHIFYELRRGGKLGFLCSGIILSKWKVLTVASCFQGINETRIQIEGNA